MDVESGSQMGIRGRKAFFARAKPNGSMALFNAWLDVAGTAPGMFATQ
jgi:hypothetical protein